jgi:PLP dependent protein
MSFALTDPPATDNSGYISLLKRMRKALVLAGRPEDGAYLTAVTKNQPWAMIEPVIKAGQRRFGENRVQEAMSRWAEKRDIYPDLDLRLIGPLQSNKAAEAVAFFDVIETIDRDKIAQAIAQEQQKQGRSIRLYVQINIGEEAQKTGILPLESDTFLKYARETYGLLIEGLMCIPPLSGPRGPYFALLAKIAANNNINHLSMGMSDDFETALRFGANEVRIGSALFGGRP